MTLTIREPGSAITHGIALLMAMLAAAPLLVKASASSPLCLEAMTVFISSMILLYAASTIYHSVTVPPRVLKVFRKADHMMIFVLIAGTYTPVCLLTLGHQLGMRMCAVIWLLAAAGMIIKMCWITCPKWFSSVIYIAMGWSCVFVLRPIADSLGAGGMAWLAAGGVIYTVGGVIYALKVPLFDARHANFGSHEIFHLFVMGGSLCHFICMYKYVA